MSWNIENIFWFWNLNKSFKILTLKIYHKDRQSECLIYYYKTKDEKGLIKISKEIESLEYLNKKGKRKCEE